MKKSSTTQHNTEEKDVRTFRIFTKMAWSQYQTRTEFKQEMGTMPEIFSRKYSSLKAAVEAANKSGIKNLVVMKRNQIGEYRWTTCYII